jgi:hypothetical protein
MTILIALDACDPPTAAAKPVAPTIAAFLMAGAAPRRANVPPNELKPAVS